MRTHLAPQPAHQPSRRVRAAVTALLCWVSLSGALAAVRTGDSSPQALNAACNLDSVKQATALIYRDSNLDGATAIAQRCEALGSAQGHAFEKVLALRIRALIAMRTHNLPALKQAGEALVVQGQMPEYVADGHMLIAFACVFGGNPRCAREHAGVARTLFTQLQANDALTQLQPIEQMVAQLEDQGEPR